ncbi:hypothetical protein CEXT_188911 [Caerostris extrusa]|uniref:Uncharacterized protein n=1 Tax=Caerostris extrusa TaxID=172846 RepID=A0AAV4NMZ8_CAEEX|nr:hypothetical protein CEXT_188911 [Caerostris extrusa]
MKWPLPIQQENREGGLKESFAPPSIIPSASVVSFEKGATGAQKKTAQVHSRQNHFWANELFALFLIPQNLSCGLVEGQCCPEQGCRSRTCIAHASRQTDAFPRYPKIIVLWRIVI